MTDLFSGTLFMIRECVCCLFLVVVGGTDGIGRVTPKNNGRKPARSSVIFSCAGQIDGGSGQQ